MTNINKKINNKIYKFREKKDNGIIIYDKFLIDTGKYNIINYNNQLILKPKSTIIKIQNLKNFDKDCENFKNSIILSCYIIGSGKTIIKNTLMNIDTLHINDKEYKYLENLGISVQYKKISFYI